MKKLGLLAAMAAVYLGGGYAVDVSAHLNLEGNLANGGKGTSTRFFELNKQAEADPDAFVFSITGEKAGMEMDLVWQFKHLDTGSELYTPTVTVTVEQDEDKKITSCTTSSSNNSAVQIRKASVWFKPFDWFKVTVGSVNQFVFKDYMRFWEDVYGAPAGFQKWMSYRDSSGVDGAGVKLSFTPIDPLLIEVGIAPGTSDDANDTEGAFWDWNGNHVEDYAQWGVTAKYKLADNISIGAGYADNGMHKYKLASLGVDFGAPFGAPYYAFIMPRFYFGDKKHSEINPQAHGYVRNENIGEYALTGITLDNWVRYNVNDNLSLQARLPFTIRLTGEDDDPSYLLYDFELDYRVNPTLTPYLRIDNMDSIFAPLGFGSDGYGVGDTFIMAVRPGAKFMFDNCEFNVSLLVYFGPGMDSDNKIGKTLYGTGADKIGWRIPFGVNITF